MRLTVCLTKNRFGESIILLDGSFEADALTVFSHLSCLLCINQLIFN